MFFKINLCALICVLVLHIVNAGVAPFITPCKGNDQECIAKSTKAAIPKVAAGIPELGVDSLDPLHVDEAVGDQGDLKLKFLDTTVTGTSKCDVIKVERNVEKSSLHFEVACPLEINGNYEVSGKVLVVNVEGKDKYHIYTDKVKILVEAVLDTVDGKDGKKHWKIEKWTHSFELLEKVNLKFDNLFNGNKALSEPVDKLLDEHWKELVEGLGKPIIDKFITKAVEIVSKFIAAVPADELEVI